MVSDSLIYDELNKKWKATSRIVFGEEVGELRDFKTWLVGDSKKALERKSSISGKNVSFVLPYYSKSAKVASLDEIGLSNKFEPVSINDIKDIDSILSAVQERFYYAGNIWLGESKQISESTDVIDSSGILGSSQVSYSKWIAYCYNLEYGEHLFGCQNTGYCKFSVRLNSSGQQNRCFEVCTANANQDCYYSNSIFNCNNCMFTFGVRSASYCIGNLKMPQDKYLEIKKKLLTEIAEKLKRDKRLPQLVDLIKPYPQDTRRAKIILAQSVPLPPDPPTNLANIEAAFEKTTTIVLGKMLKNLDRYGSWLKEHVRDTKICPSAVTGRKVVVPDQGNCFNYPENRIISESESVVISKHLSISIGQVEGLNLENVGELVRDIAFFSSGQNFGELGNNIESEVCVSSQNTLRTILSLESKNGAYNYYSLQSESLFGCNSLRKSTFCIRCSLSANLARCFEVDSSRACSDCYFCHNCENVRDSMFCFNAKNLTYAIGNVELPKEKYLEIKKKVLDEIVSVLEKDERYDLSIFNICDRKKK